MTTKSSPGRRKGAYSQAMRVLAILELVRREGAPVPLARIASQFALSERQARRDVAMLAESGHARSVIVEGRSAVVGTEPEAVRLIDRVELAIRVRHELRVQLASEREGSRTMTFLPYAIVVHPSGPHVIGRWDLGEPIRAVPIERFAHVEVAVGTVVAAPQGLDLFRLFEAPRASASRTVHS